MNAMKGFALFLAVTLCFPALAGAFNEEDGAIIHKTFTLHKGEKGNPFTLHYPLELTEPGEINVYLKVEDIDPKGNIVNFQPLRAIVVDARAFKKMEPSEWKQFCVNVNKYNPLEWVAGDEIRSFVKGVKSLFGDKEKPPAYFHGQIAFGVAGRGESIKHAVDSVELQKTQGRYVVIVRNMVPVKATGGILIRYPGKTWDFDPTVERYALVHPDLAVEGAALNSNGRLEVKLANRGQGVVNLGHWHRAGDKAVTLVARVDGRSYGVTLQSFDRNRQLRLSGGTLSYVFENIRIDKSSSTSVTIDAGNMILESNEGNNTLEQQLGGPKLTGLGVKKIVSTAARKPDLAITSIRLNPGKVIEVEVQNKGNAGVDQAFWTSGNAPHLNLKMNGNGWANVSLVMVDPARNLTRPGGTAVYSTGYVLRQNAEITALVDMEGMIEETDEENNTLKVMLRP